jgi:uncharacterized protein
MLKLLDTHRAEIADLCRRFHVRRLDVFGSAARETDFDPARSDVDLLVAYLPGRVPSFGDDLALRDALADLLGRKVDLVEADAVRNPFIRAGIERSRQPLYAA